MNDNSTTSSSQRQVLQEAAEYLRAKPPWVRGVISAFRRFLFIAIPVVIWALLLLVDGILPERLLFGLTLAMVVVLFLLSIPLSILHRLDTILSAVMDFSGSSRSIALLVALCYVLVNFVVIGAIVGFVRGKRRGAGPGRR